MNMTARIMGVRIRDKEKMRKFCGDVRKAAKSYDRVTVYYDGQIFDFRTRGHEIPEDEMLIIGVYSGTVTVAQLMEDIEFVIRGKKK